MRQSTALGLMGAVQLAMAAYDSPPEAIVKFCGERKQFPHRVNGKWKCVQVSDICDPDQDIGTLHQDHETGAWKCCPKDEILTEDGNGCMHHKQETPATCTDRIAESGLEVFLDNILGDCFPGDRAVRDAFILQYVHNLQEGLALITGIYGNDCPRPKQSSSPVPSSSPVRRDAVPLAPDWWKCPKDNSPCTWLSLENDEQPKVLESTGYKYRILPNPNVFVDNYQYPFDTWVVKLSGDDLRLYVEGEPIKAQGDGTRYLIPGGTLASDVFYRSMQDIEVQYYGSCSVDTPCVNGEILPWTETAGLTAEGVDRVLDVRGFDSDLVLTISDTSVAMEQYVVFADGEEVGKTHGKPILGDDKYNTKHLTNEAIGNGAAAALKGISTNGFWGSFLIPKETEMVTIRLHYQAYEDSTYLYAYRIDQLCRC